jgi:hypothetical protein
MAPFHAKKIYEYGYLNMNVVNETTIHFQFINVGKGIDDEFWIIKDKIN